MIENFKINLKEIDKINLINQDDKNYRIKNLEFFNQKGLPTKKDEDWKFSDLREIFSKNFKKIDVNNSKPEENKFRLIKDFDHNYILLINGRFIRSDFKFEDKSKVKYDYMMKSLTEIDLSNIYEGEDETDLSGELACAGGACEIT